MARLHVLTGAGIGRFTCVLHESVPAGNNLVGVPWKTALVNSGIGGKTRMTEGTGAGQITTAEKALIASGDLYEIVFDFDDNPAWTPAERLVALDTQIATISSETQAMLAIALRLFGYTRT